jgi:predicted kinase
MITGNDPRQPALVLLSGLPGAGKTTFAQALKRRLPATVIESDAIRRSLSRQPTYEPGESARVFGIAERNVARALDQGRVAILDATSLTKGDRRRFLRCARDHDARVIAVRLTAPEDVVVERLSRGRRGHSEADVDVYQRMRERVQPFSIPLIVVDSRFDPGPSLDLVTSLVMQSD